MKFFALFSLFLLSACGFTPVHGDRAISNDISTITIAVIPNRSGQIVRNHLIDSLHLNGTPTNLEFILITSPIIETEVEIGIDEDDEASRAQLRFRTNIQLRDTKSGEIVLNRTIRATTGYNILAGQFTTFVTENDARNNGLQILADNIVTQIQLYFNR